MSDIRYAPEAEEDLARIKEYISEELGNSTAALNTVAKITKRIRSLEQFQEMGTRLSAIIDLDTDYRFLVCANYIAFYRTDGIHVCIARILHGRRDYVKLLFSDLPQDEAE